ncbi:MAG: ABC-F family ATP-binding cassette domain-containing protein [Gammaproteobacteria bacterium]
MLQLTDIALQRGGRVIFNGLSSTIHAGQKYGIVGRNGAGKSTLFNLLLGALKPATGTRSEAASADTVRDDALSDWTPMTPERGAVSVPAGWRVSFMAQQVAASDRPALDFVIDGHAELRRVERDLAAAEAADAPLRAAELHARFADLNGYSARADAAAILHGLGFASGTFDRAYHTFSGGWRIRLNLAQALMRPADLLLLDEPTNHLDLDATLWLETWLTRFSGTLLVIAHDRAFLDRVTDHTLHLHDAEATTYRGNYSEFERQRAEALLLQQAAFERQQAARKHMEAFVARFRAKATKARQAQSRLKALERMESVAPVYADSPYQVSFPTPDRMSTPLLNFDRVAAGYGSTCVLSGINRSILPGARIGILGANGAGKSTLLKTLVGALPPQDGAVVQGANAGIGYFAQHQLETLDPALTVLQQLLQARPGGREQWGRDYLGGWGFSGDLAERRCAVLSGGEKARLALALLTLDEPALLVLDEPTNHLDLDMREALALALQEYGGALVLVSHDRSLLARVVDDLWLVSDGRVTTFDGDLDAYTTTRAPVTGTRATSHERRAARQESAAARQREKPLRDQARKLEARIETLTNQLRTIESRLADVNIYQSLPAAELDALLTESGRLRKDIESAETAWFEAEAALEALARGDP